jgi:glycosyltransferase involved in cell wall biosynthesis
MKMLKFKVLVFIGCYLPGYKAGGPVRAIANMVERLGDEFAFKIITADRDLTDTRSYPGINIDGWNKYGNAEVFYMSLQKRSLRDFRKLLCTTEYDVLYLNSFFSYFTIKPLLLRALRLILYKPVVIAPRGEFSCSALGLKWFKKRVYVAVFKFFGLHNRIIWQASSQFEEQDIRSCLGNNVHVIVASDLPPLAYIVNDLSLKKKKVKNCLKVVFLSRISRMKNLYSALEMLTGLKGQIKFNMYGPIDDRQYWIECQGVIRGLPKNIEVKYYGDLAHEQVMNVLREHDLLFLPTLGENFGHVILEAFNAGCPVLISDRTQWRGLEEKGVGWDLPLCQPELFKNALQLCINMDEIEHEKWSEKARAYGLQVIKNNELIKQNRLLFQQAISPAHIQQI